MGCANSRDYQGVHRNEVKEFLILLREDDYKSCPMNKTHYEKLQNTNFPGILHCINFNDINDKYENGDLKYIISGSTVPRSTYIKLPKEGIYVDSERYEFEYMNSQINEIITMFTLLGAKSIKYDVSGNKGEHKSVATDLSIADPSIDLDVGVGATMSNSKISESHMSGYIEISRPDEVNPSREVLEDSGQMYYLPRKQSWRNIAKRRIEKTVLIDNFTFKFSNDLKFDAGLTAKFSKLGVSCNFNTNSLTNFKMSFEVEYYSRSISL